MKSSSKAKRGLHTRFHAMSTDRLEEVRSQIEKVSVRFGVFIMERVQGKVVSTPSANNEDLGIAPNTVSRADGDQRG